MTSPRRTIHTQGDLDGACFLYAIANALTAPTGNSPDLKAWGSCVRELPHAVNFIDGSARGFHQVEGGHPAGDGGGIGLNHFVNGEKDVVGHVGFIIGRLGTGTSFVPGPPFHLEQGDVLRRPLPEDGGPIPPNP